SSFSARPRTGVRGRRLRREAAGDERERDDGFGGRGLCRRAALDREFARRGAARPFYRIAKRGDLGAARASTKRSGPVRTRVGLDGLLGTGCERTVEPG